MYKYKQYIVLAVWLLLVHNTLAQMPPQFVSRLREANRRGRLSTGVNWDDPHASSLVFCYRFDPAYTNAAGYYIDTMGYPGSTNFSTSLGNAMSWKTIGTNINGRVEHSLSSSNGFVSDVPEPTLNSTACTMAVWVKLKGAIQYGSFMESRGYGPIWGLGTGPVPNTLRALIPGGYAYSANNVWTNNGTYHFAATWCKDVNAGVPLLYLNGTNIPSTGGTVARTSALLASGDGAMFGTGTYVGVPREPVAEFDDFRMYTNVYFTSDDIALLYTNTLHPNGDIETMLDPIVRTPSTATNWVDPNASSLAFCYRFQGVFTNASRQFIDSSANNYLGYPTTNVGGTLTWSSINTNVNGRLEYVLASKSAYFTNAIPDPMNGTTACTMSVWIRSRAACAYGGVMQCKRTGAFWGIYTGSGVGGLQYGIQFNDNCTVLTPTPISSYFQWVHLLSTWCKDINTGIPLLYVNGKLRAPDVGAVGRTTALAATGPGAIFCSITTGLTNNALWADFDDFRMYTNKFFSSSDAAGVYSNTLHELTPLFPNGNVEQ